MSNQFLPNSSNESAPVETTPNKSLEEIFVSTFHNKYQFSNFLSFDVLAEVTKFKVRNKTIYELSKKLKAFQRFLNTCVFEYALINEEVVYSYRKGLTILNAVKKHSDNKYFFQTDISDFFGNISGNEIRNVLSHNLTNVPVNDIEKYTDRIFDLITIDRRLPVGFATSPLISNSCLLSFDNELQGFCIKNGITYSRYSDDLILSTNDDKALLNFDEILSELLNKHFHDSLKLNPAKTKHTHKGKKIKLLGLIVLPTGKITVDIRVKRKIEALLHFYITDKQKFSELAGGSYETGLAKVSGQLNYINMIDSEYLNKLRKKYGNTVVDMFFHKSVK